MLDMLKDKALQSIENCILFGQIRLSFVLAIPKHTKGIKSIGGYCNSETIAMF